MPSLCRKPQAPDASRRKLWNYVDTSASDIVFLSLALDPRIKPQKLGQYSPYLEGQCLFHPTDNNNVKRIGQDMYIGMTDEHSTTLIANRNFDARARDELVNYLKETPVDELPFT